MNCRYHRPRCQRSRCLRSFVRKQGEGVLLHNLLTGGDWVIGMRILIPLHNGLNCWSSYLKSPLVFSDYKANGSSYPSYRIVPVGDFVVDELEKEPLEGERGKAVLTGGSSMLGSSCPLAIDRMKSSREYCHGVNNKIQQEYCHGINIKIQQEYFHGVNNKIKNIKRYGKENCAILNTTPHILPRKIITHSLTWAAKSALAQTRISAMTWRKQSTTIPGVREARGFRCDRSRFLGVRIREILKEVGIIKQNEYEYICVLVDFIWYDEGFTSVRKRQVKYRIYQEIQSFFWTKVKP